MNHELAKTLTTALVQFIDRERPEGTMCCSNTDCANLENAFNGENFNYIEAYIKWKLSRLTEFETHLKWLIENGGSGIEHVKAEAKELLALAKKELLSYADESNPAIEAMADLERTYFCNPDKLPKWLTDDIARKELNAHTKGYNKGYKDAEKRYNESVAYHYPDPIPPGVAYKSPQCYTDVMITPNTNSGTSTLKAEG